MLCGPKLCLRNANLSYLSRAVATQSVAELCNAVAIHGKSSLCSATACPCLTAQCRGGSVRGVSSHCHAAAHRCQAMLSPGISVFRCALARLSLASPLLCVSLRSHAVAALIHARPFYAVAGLVNAERSELCSSIADLGNSVLCLCRSVPDPSVHILAFASHLNAIRGHAFALLFCAVLCCSLPCHCYAVRRSSKPCHRSALLGGAAPQRGSAGLFPAIASRIMTVRGHAIADQSLISSQWKRPLQVEPPLLMAFEIVHGASPKWRAASLTEGNTFPDSTCRMVFLWL